MTYLRRFKPIHLSQGGRVSPEAFQCEEGEAGLSLTLIDESLNDKASQVRYWYHHRRAGSNDCLGLAKIALGSLIGRSVVSQPMKKPIDGPYGELHYEIDCPDDVAADALANVSVTLLHPMKGEFAAHLALANETPSALE